LEEAVHSIIYAAPKIESVKELSQARALLAEKFGKEFTLHAVENSEGKVPARVLDRLRVEPPSKELVDAYLSTIAEAYDIDYPPGTKAKRRAEEEAAQEKADGAADDDNDEPSGGQTIKSLEAPLATRELNRATPPRDLGPRSPVAVMPPSPSTDNVRPKINLPGPPDLTPSKKMLDAAVKKNSSNGPGGKIPDVDELARRFADLKK
jgi:vacuolar protein sorting-associated protein IST1